jgi:hypothetical protein
MAHRLCRAGIAEAGGYGSEPKLAAEEVEQPFVRLKEIDITVSSSQDRRRFLNSGRE